MSPFDYVKIINNKSEIPETFDGYNQFIINRHFSYFMDTAFIAMEAATRQFTDDQHFRFFYDMIPKANRFAKWEKASKYDNIEIIKKFYGYNDKQAQDVIELFNEDDIEKIKKKGNIGGRL